MLEKLKDDAYYYGKGGQKFLSNSDIGKLLTDPLSFREPSEFKAAFLFGSYFHVAALEPHKVDKFKIVDTTSRRTKVYKEAVGEGHGLLMKEKEQADKMIQAVREHELANRLVFSGDVKYEVPGVCEMEGLPWKGKADIVNHTEKLVVDLKSSYDVRSFEDSIYKWGYNSQAYVYSQLFGYNLCFVAVGKKDCKIKIVEADKQMLETGAERVAKAAAVYKDWFGDINDNYWKN